ncbi:MAG: hypothetical protein A2W93_00340 [Bacteroidetes bacterium GWF2_43_63]|nr:MAG: hypothetical protein A2W94_13180 [Bacteroidetes bacterium GWE2_42_42]OFY53854.1 MAG: hypothetical protein A2W93_00340 [Bacteroidetes bacterium GWF2_43_63]HBG69812.1 hypothetical protein [Bacteroidales bacterium]HCB60990.1 hypothetical protein [Bacteroidales bacterium]HCY24546.1 hypothetical protein [Bacteroidales bacterium]
MKEYRFTEKNAKRTAKSMALSLIPMMIVAVGVGVYLSDMQSKESIFDNTTLVIIIIVVLALTTAGGLYLGFRMLVRRLMGESYRLTESGIEKIAQTGVVIRINYDEVEKHKLQKNGYYFKAKGKQIFIPSGLDLFDELKKEIVEKLK